MPVPYQHLYAQLKHDLEHGLPYYPTNIPNHVFLLKKCFPPILLQHCNRRCKLLSMKRLCVAAVWQQKNCRHTAATCNNRIFSMIRGIVAVLQQNQGKTFYMVKSGKMAGLEVQYRAIGSTVPTFRKRCSERSEALFRRLVTTVPILRHHGIMKFVTCNKALCNVLKRHL